jgi:tRNA(Ile)-lysidine synthase
MATRTSYLNWTRHLFRAGERVAVAVSGGADSVALLVAMAESRAETGIVLSAIHVHHGLRGAEADGDAEFVAQLAKRLDVPLCVRRGDVGALAAERGQGIEEAARALRYQSFQELLAKPEVDAVATAHTLDDQAETVLMKMLRGAWTEGLGGIAPVVTMKGGCIVRPLLEVTRAEVVAYLEGRGEPWREDSTNQELTFTRNRVRHTLLPQLREFQPRIAEQLSRMAAVARDEESWWTRELARVMPGMVLPGKPVRGGGRANSTRPGEAGVAMELERLRALHPALQRRVLRAAAEQLGSPLGFDQTEAVRALTDPGERVAGKGGRVELGAGLIAERTARELRLSRSSEQTPSRLPELVVPVPGVLEASEYGYRVTTEGRLPSGTTLVLRTPQPGDQVRLPHSRGVKTVKEVLERRGLSAAQRRLCPVLATGSSILWMSGVEVEWTPGLQVAVEPFGEWGQPPEGAPDAT